MGTWRLLLMVHMGAGSLAIVSVAAAVVVCKRQRPHRVLGAVFVLSMLIMSALGVYLALLGDRPDAGATPPKASVAVGLLTFYLIVTAWVIARRRTGGVSAIDYAALLLALGVQGALLTFGVQAWIVAQRRPSAYAPYFLFAVFAGALAGLDIKLICKGGVVGVARLSGHLWRMCFAPFFAAAFFFLGQQKVMPRSLHGSPLLTALATAPLAVMIFWLVRERWTNRPLTETRA